MRFTSIVVPMLIAAAAHGQVGFVDFDGTETGLTAYTNATVTFTGIGLGTAAEEVSDNGTTTWGPGDAFWPMSRNVVGPFSTTAAQAYGMPFAISDDSVEPAAGNTVFEIDAEGFAGIAQNDNGFFGIVDTVNNQNASGEATAEFVFDVRGTKSLTVSADFAAMGDFAAINDFYQMEYTFDDGFFVTLFTFTVSEDTEQTYTMDNPDNNPVVIPDPLRVDGTPLDDTFQTIEKTLIGSGSTLTIRVYAMTNGGSTGVGFDNLTVAETLENDCPADINGTGSVGFDDLQELLQAWGQCPAPPLPCPADITGTGSVGFDDLQALLQMWGPCP